MQNQTYYNIIKHYKGHFKVFEHKTQSTFETVVMT